MLFIHNETRFNPHPMSHPIRPIHLLPLLVLLTSCGLHHVPLDPANLTPMTSANTPSLTRAADGTRSAQFRPTLTGRTATFPYNSLYWTFARLPVIESDAGDLVLLDTGMDAPAHITLDLARDLKLPSHLGQPFDFARADSLDLQTVTARDLPATIDRHQWVYQLFGLPLHRSRGWTLGLPLLRQTRYLSFDNPRKRVTLGFENFEPANPADWTSYPLTIHNNAPFVELPLAGQTIKLLADSAGGPHLILNPAQWELLKPHVEIRSHTTSSYPTWTGLQPVDVYTLRHLPLGPLHLYDEPVWVRKGESLESLPLLGLGLLEHHTTVYDFSAHLLWIRTVPARP